MANAENIQIQVTPSAACDTFVFYDKTGTQPSQANGYNTASYSLGALVGTISLYGSDGVLIDTYTLTPDGDPAADYEFAPSDFGIASFDDGVYKVTYNVMNGSTQIGLTAVWMLIFQCTLINSMTVTAARYASGECGGCGCESEIPGDLHNAHERLTMSYFLANINDHTNSQKEFAAAQRIVSRICDCT